MVDRTKRQADGEKLLKEFEKSSEQHKVIMASLLQNLEAAERQADELEKRHGEEVKAANHLAHVKDLSRVAAIRELNIEREKLISDLKYNKDVHSIMSFSLMTAEQSLTESQPHVVQKLVEGRGKRLKALEKELKEQKRDLDQRSMDTCLVSATHLEEFVSKSEKKYSEASAEAQVAHKKLKELIRSTHFLKKTDDANSLLI